MSFVANSWNNVRTFTNKAIPVVAEVVENTLGAVDTGCMAVNKSTVRFLTKYPGIAMTLSPSSVIKMAVANHVDDLMGRKGQSPAGKVINMTMNNKD